MEKLVYGLEEEISEARIALAKGECLLHELINRYNFAESPASSENNKLCWVYEHDKIMKYINIIGDYAFEVRKKLAEMSALLEAEHNSDINMVKEHDIA